MELFVQERQQQEFQIMTSDLFVGYVGIALR